MVAEVEAAIDPDAVVVDVNVILGPDGPLAGGGDPLSLQTSVRRLRETAEAGRTYLCTLSPDHGVVRCGGSGGLLQGLDAL